MSSRDVESGQGSRPPGASGRVIWLTGLSGAGKSALAAALAPRLATAPHRAAILHGDDVRRGLCADLGFSRRDRAENVRRVAHVAVLIASAGPDCIVALISPYAADRSKARAIAAGSGVVFVEVFVDAPLHVCEQRDPKGLYRSARAGALRGMTGVEDRYEPPSDPDVHVRTDVSTVDECVVQVITRADRAREGRR